MSRYKHREKKSFAGIPRRVIDSAAYKSLDGNAVKLLVNIAYFYNGKNNGNISITMSLLKPWFNSNTTLYRARDQLYEKGFIVINSFGGRSMNGKKLPHLYALTWAPVDQVEDKTFNVRIFHYKSSNISLNYWMSGKNPDFKNLEERSRQYKRDIKKTCTQSETY